MKNRDWILPTVLWVVLTAIGEWVISAFSFYPGRFAHEAEVSDDAFQLLMILAVPVFAFVIAMMITSIARWRSSGDPNSDGPHIAGNSKVVGFWMVITVGLTIVLIINPGFVGIAEMMAHDKDEDLLVQIEGARWAWTVKYPEQKVTAFDELVLPIHKTVKFEVSTRDIIHSFWVPGFRVKIDAVPGKTTVTYATPDKLGSYETDVGMRLQCAELCGLNHATMMMPVRVVEEAEFEAWLAKTREEASKLPEDCPTLSDNIEIAAFNIAFDKKCLVVPAGKEIKLTFDNKEAVPHNFSVFADPDFKDPLYTGPIFSGPAVRELKLGPFEAGDDRFQCDLHPIPAMRGFFIVREAA